MSPGGDGREGLARYHANQAAISAGRVTPPPLDRPASDGREGLARYHAHLARAERADPGTRGMVEARDFQAAGGRFDDADSTQRLIDATARRAAERAERRQAEDRETDAQLRHDRFPFWVDRDRPEPGPTDRPALIERAHQERTRTMGNSGDPKQAKARDDTEARRRVTDTLRAPQGADYRHFQDGRRASDTPAADRRARDGANDRPHRMQGQTRDRAHWHGDRPGASYADRMVGRTRGRGEEQQR